MCVECALWLRSHCGTGVSVYEVVGKAEYKAAAEFSGNFILKIAEGNFLGDEAFALALLTEVAGDTTYADADDRQRRSARGCPASAFCPICAGKETVGDFVTAENPRPPSARCSCVAGQRAGRSHKL